MQVAGSYFGWLRSPGTKPSASGPTAIFSLSRSSSLAVSTSISANGPWPIRSAAPNTSKKVEFDVAQIALVMAHCQAPWSHNRERLPISNITMLLRVTYARARGLTLCVAFVTFAFLALVRHGFRSCAARR